MPMSVQCQGIEVASLLDSVFLNPFLRWYKKNSDRMQMFGKKSDKYSENKFSLCKNGSGNCISLPGGQVNTYWAYFPLLRSKYENN
jgi:hypothetical protein